VFDVSRRLALELTVGLETLGQAAFRGGTWLPGMVLVFALVWWCLPPKPGCWFFIILFFVTVATGMPV
jgi:hypothetical protein